MGSAGSKASRQVEETRVPKVISRCLENKKKLRAANEAFFSICEDKRKYWSYDRRRARESSADRLLVVVRHLGTPCPGNELDTAKPVGAHGSD